jgi:hypothetical protein
VPRPDRSRSWRVAQNYSGYLEDGTKFDSSYDKDKPFSFRLNKGKVISGWEAIVPGMKVGSKVIVKIPPQFACAPHTARARRALASPTSLAHVTPCRNGRVRGRWRQGHRADPSQLAPDLLHGARRARRDPRRQAATPIPSRRGAQELIGCLSCGRHCVMRERRPRPRRSARPDTSHKSHVQGVPQGREHRAHSGEWGKRGSRVRATILTSHDSQKWASQPLRALKKSPVRTGAWGPAHLRPGRSRWGT